ncbi:MAG: hypothetical protein COZ49_00495 [Candidatus Yonathbacteria bacterium CG_4_10_14_3_um_filter_47_65]|uniref:Adenylate kinase n=2 Tax=Parcubacteria group TaxID=1794811 RepID=A0A2M8D7A3_9BACT|nr:MAG: hypothetical protein AUJ44_00970 [Candidatus Nomurabacteria bacterium CG1_02_47_685]PIP03850.1 MAG: hypothetical protein COX54_02285 [Candidatus Yonathbacteria bacterium CG23_combo_of_CG06-09_8_20_14_all_46_18]PIQ32001.1 MAG: hypothetical protein COW61_02660 [Candidatus Yonathbacteria bacterium CG17_big_fil_post_rev_8_21_14_2_50_46_19]PIX56749.1 MAG: hypothetical protein COZ49_00495 [Candidatus Yonathbacteria bacterium CG_4_10_14_3_um_filter_47_65]PIY57787.1 MAG: hypothetical protein CO
MGHKTFIFIGTSGCGKGTQAKLLRAYLEKNDHGIEIFYLQTGSHFREFIKGDTYTQKLANEIMEDGEREPDFLAVWIWSEAFIKNIENKEHFIIDGTPRSLNEAVVLDTAIRFYKRGKPYVVFINTSREWARERLRGRGRADDKEESDVENRLNFFETDVMPAVEYYRQNPDYIFLEINGEQSIEDVHHDIAAKLSE